MKLDNQALHKWNLNMKISFFYDKKGGQQCVNGHRDVHADSQKK